MQQFVAGPQRSLASSPLAIGRVPLQKLATTGKEVVNDQPSLFVCGSRLALRISASLLSPTDIVSSDGLTRPMARHGSTGWKAALAATIHDMQKVRSSYPELVFRLD